MTIADTDASTRHDSNLCGRRHLQRIDHLSRNSVYYTGRPASTVTEQSDGSGDITLNLYGATYTATKARSSGSIAIAKRRAIQTTRRVYADIGTWQARGLYAETTTTWGRRHCGVCKTARRLTSVDKLVQLISRLDTVFGYTTQRRSIRTSRRLRRGLLGYDDTLTQYYNVQGDIQPAACSFRDLFWSSTRIKSRQQRRRSHYRAARYGIDAAIVGSERMRAARALRGARTRRTSRDPGGSRDERTSGLVFCGLACLQRLLPAVAVAVPESLERAALPANHHSAGRAGHWDGANIQRGAVYVGPAQFAAMGVDVAVICRMNRGSKPTRARSAIRVQDSTATT